MEQRNIGTYRSLRSMRGLRGQHIDLLKRIKEDGLNTIEKLRFR
jgi:hypothetical protein